MHNQEFDAVHEAAIVHPMAVILPALIAESAARPPLTGEAALLATVVALDVAVNIGMSATAPVSFYRQGMCAAMGATVGIGLTRGYDADRVRAALGHCYSQLSGTMQAHSEGSAALPLQMGFNARAALGALDLAESGVPAPYDMLEGRFGYFALMEESWSPERFDSHADTRWRIEELSHKPWPTGRATHATLSVLLDLVTSRSIDAQTIASIDVVVPELVARLVDRPAQAAMSPNYARLCLPYVSACVLMDGDVRVEHFDREALDNDARLRCSERVRVSLDPDAPAHALSPQTITVTLTDGSRLQSTTGALPGHPERPLSRQQWLEKFRRCCDSALPAVPEERIVALIDVFDALPHVGDMRSVAELMTVSGEPG